MHAAVGERYGHAAVRIAQNNANGVGVETEEHQATRTLNQFGDLDIRMG